MIIEVVPQAYLQSLDPRYGYENPGDPLMTEARTDTSSKGGSS